MKIALVYDRVNKWGGAERVLLVLHEMFPEAPLYTSVYNLKTAPWAKVFSPIYTSFLQKFPFAKSNHEFYAPLMPLAFESFDFGGYDLVISVTSEAAKGIITKPETKHLCYCLTPTRYLWSGSTDYFKSRFLKIVSLKVVAFLRDWDKVAAQRPDRIISISSAVERRVKKYYGRDSEIVFPPVEIPEVAIVNHPRGGYFLIVSRLVGYKKVDLAVRAFNKLKLPLVVVGTGSQAKSLKQKAKSNIKFVGQLSDEELVKYYQGAKALIMPQEEDFGLVALEAQSFGVPVIAYRKGGAADTVVEAKTGIFFDKQTPESLIRAIRKFDKWHPNKEELITHAARFSKEIFKRRFLKVIKNL